VIQITTNPFENDYHYNMKSESAWVDPIGIRQGAQEGSPFNLLGDMANDTRVLALQLDKKSESAWVDPIAIRQDAQEGSPFDLAANLSYDIR